LSQDIFTKTKAMVFPRQVLAGHGVIERTADVLSNLGIGGSILIVTGPSTRAVAAERVNTLLQEAGFKTEIVVSGAATVSNVDIVSRRASRFKPVAIVGVGGGSKIDIAKMVAAKKGLHFISIPTSASHDGISSPRASIKGNGLSHSMEGTMPLAIIADTEIIAKAPYRMLAAGCADVLSNSTAVLDWELAVRAGRETMSTTALTLSKYASAEIEQHASRIRVYDETATWLAVRPIIASGLAIGAAGSSRPASGAEHLFSHALEAAGKGNALHGEQCGVGAIMIMALHGGDWERLRNTLITLGCPVSASELGLTPGDIVNALLSARKMRRDRYTILDEKKLDRKSAEKLARETGVI
jgi:glycerol-1-phosphate dehydrogenase [NAD(P)+]